MLFLTFQIVNDRYAVEANRVVEVLPLLALKRLPQAPAGVAGLFNLRGQPVPAIDLSELSFGKTVEERLSTRIILVEYTDARGVRHPLGLIAERVTQTLRKEPKDFIHPGINLAQAPYLGPVLMDAQGPIQWLRTEHLVSEPFRQLLFPETQPGSAAAPAWQD
jgi:chemotaxis-related protein WspB